jgi:hypothetical protein
MAATIHNNLSGVEFCARGSLVILKSRLERIGFICRLRSERAGIWNCLPVGPKTNPA